MNERKTVLAVGVYPSGLVLLEYEMQDCDKWKNGNNEKIMINKWGHFIEVFKCHTKQPGFYPQKSR